MTKKLHKNQSVNYLQGFWIDFIKDAMLRVATLAQLHFKRFNPRIKAGIIAFKKWWKLHRPKHLEVHIKVTFTRLIIIGFLVFNMWPSPGRSIAVDKPKTKPPVSLVKPLEQTKLAEQQELAPLAPPAPVTPPAPVYAASTCITGYHAPDYYEDLLIQRESGGQSCVTNLGGCVGLLQACPGSKLYAVCPTLEVNCQLQFFTAYMLSSYGSWANAWAQDEARYPHWW